MNRPCPVSITCPGVDEPVLNTSSEAPDEFLFTAINYSPFDPYRPPPLGDGLYTAKDCFGQTISALSQQDADLLAAATAAQCQDPVPTQSGGWFFNYEATCAVKCSDGNEFTYVVPAGRFASPTQIGAQSQANAYACQQAASHKMCLGSATGTEFCISEPLLLNISATGTYVDQNSIWVIVSGSLPSGVTLSSVSPDGHTASISGTPTQSGTFAFTVRLTASNGDYVQKSYTICVIAINPASLPDGTVSTAYSETLTASACATAPLSWQVESGSLPTGLTLDETTGVISGTPTVAGTYTFTISVQTAST